jgi:hypothetical protein
MDLFLGRRGRRSYRMSSEESAGIAEDWPEGRFAGSEPAIQQTRRTSESALRAPIWYWARSARADTGLRTIPRSALTCLAPGGVKDSWIAFDFCAGYLRL